MTLNAFRDEAGAFLKTVDPAGAEPVTKIVGMLEEEIALLKAALGEPLGAPNDEPDRLCHQVYDVLFLLFELAARKDLDLDREWARGRERKRVYTDK